MQAAFEAVKQGNKPKVSALNNINQRDEDGKTLIYHSCELNHVSIVKYLLSTEKVNVNIVEYKFKRSPLHVACINNSPELVTKLVLYGADINLKTIWGETPLFLATIHQNLTCCEILVHNNANVNNASYKGITPLHYASENGYIEIVELLLGHGAMIDVVDNKSCTPLFKAAQNGHSKVMKMLLEAKASFSVVDRENISPLYISSEMGHLEVVQHLIRHGAKVCGTEYSSPLLISSYSGHLPVVKYLVSQGAEVNAKDDNNATALFFACSNGHTEIAQYLINHQADIALVYKNKQTPLHVAVENNHYETVKMLVSNGACIDVEDSNGMTSIDIATNRKHEDILQLLLKHKDVSIEAVGSGNSISTPTIALCAPENPLIDNPVIDKEELIDNQVIDKAETPDNPAIDEKVNPDKSKDKGAESGSHAREYHDKVPNTEKNEGSIVDKSVLEQQMLLLQQIIRNRTKPGPAVVTSPTDKTNGNERKSSDRDQLNEKDLSDRHLLQIAKQLKRWKTLGGMLQVSYTDIQSLMTQHEDDPIFAAWTMLRMWRDSSSEPVDQLKEQLKQAVLDVGRHDLLDVII